MCNCTLLHSGIAIRDPRVAACARACCLLIKMHQWFLILTRSVDLPFLSHVQDTFRSVSLSFSLLVISIIRSVVSCCCASAHSLAKKKDCNNTTVSKIFLEKLHVVGRESFLPDPIAFVDIFKSETLPASLLNISVWPTQSSIVFFFS